MFENIMNFFKKLSKKENKQANNSKDAAKERLHLVLMQDRANVSADFLELMKQEIIEVIKKYIDVDEREIDVRLTNKENGDGTNGAPALYANIPILNIKNESRKMELKKEENKQESNENVKKEDKPKDTKKEEKKEQEEIKIEENEKKTNTKKQDEEKIESKTSDVSKNKQKGDNGSVVSSKAQNKQIEKTKEKIKSEN